MSNTIRKWSRSNDVFQNIYRDVLLYQYGRIFKNPICKYNKITQMNTFSAVKNIARALSPQPRDKQYNNSISKIITAIIM